MELRNYVAGEWVSADNRETSTITEPAHYDHVLWQAQKSSATDAAAGIDAAAEAFRQWRRSPAQSRAAVLFGAARVLSTRSDQVARDLALEQGKTLVEAKREVQAAISSLEYFAGQAQEPVGEMFPRSETAERIWAERVPLGTTVCITPWNFPLLIPAYKVGPAIAFGNTVVLKPAGLTPRSAVYLVEAFAEAGLPPGVLNLCLGEGDRLAPALLSHPATRAVSFTGSNTVGRAIAGQLAGSPVRMQLEMGGKNPLIVLEDASPSMAASLSLQGAMGMAGQRCTATSRVILVGEAHDGFLRALHAQLSEWRVGHPLDSATTVGPVISAPQRDKILAAIESGRGAGRLVHGGGIPDDPALAHGHFIEPTVFDDVDPDAALAQDEIFGPVMALIRAGSISEAVALANGTRYGLSASVCTQDLGAVLQLIEALDFGVIHVNRATPAIERYAPFGGMKNSGSGSREQGRAAREFFTEWKTVYITSEQGNELGDKEAT